MTFQRGNNKARKLTNEDVLQIREKYLTGQYTYGSLSLIYDVSKNTIENVVKGYTWKHVAGQDLVGAERLPPSRRQYEPTPEEIAASWARVQEKLNAPQSQAPSLYSDPPPVDDREPTGDGWTRLQKEVAKLPPDTSDELGKFEKPKGD